MGDHIFISYSHADADTMQRIRADLNKAGMTTWTDEKIEPGTPSWRASIMAAINGAKCLVCILSPTAAQSKWVLEELSYADVKGKPIFAIHIAGNDDEVAILGYMNLQRIDVRGDQVRFSSGMETLIITVRQRFQIAPANPPPSAPVAPPQPAKAPEAKPQPKPQEVKPGLINLPSKSGYHYPNKFALIFIDAVEEVTGKDGLNAVLHWAKLDNLIGNSPPDNLEKAFDFADFTALCVALEEMYGPRGGKGLALRIGRTTFADALRGFGRLAGVDDLAFKVLPRSAKLKVGIPVMANIFSQFSDQISNVYDEDDDRIIYTLERCPMCWGRQADKAVCYVGQGLLQEGLRWVSGGREFSVDLSTCIAKGDDMGRYVIYKEPIE